MKKRKLKKLAKKLLKKRFLCKVPLIDEETAYDLLNEMTSMTGKNYTLREDINHESNKTTYDLIIEEDDVDSNYFYKEYWPCYIR